MNSPYQIRTARTAEQLPFQWVPPHAELLAAVPSYPTGSPVTSTVNVPTASEDWTITAPSSYPSVPVRCFVKLAPQSASKLTLNSTMQTIAFRPRPAALVEITIGPAPTKLSSNTLASFTTLSASTATTVIAVSPLLRVSIEGSVGQDILANFDKYSVPNWDGYGAEPITTETIKAAREFIQLLPDMLGKPEIAPGADGIVALEWLFRSGPLRKLFIDIGPGNVWSAYYRLANGDKQSLPHQRIDKDTKAVVYKLFYTLSA